MHLSAALGAVVVVVAVDTLIAFVLGIRHWVLGIGHQELGNKQTNNAQTIRNDLEGSISNNNNNIGAYNSQT